jgi:hypothetical protein
MLFIIYHLILSKCFLLFFKRLKAVAFVAGGILAAEGFLGGWPAIFYLTGITGIVLAIFWSMLAANSPEDHMFIKADEKNYILDKTSELVLSSKEKKV